MTGSQEATSTAVELIGEALSLTSPADQIAAVFSGAAEYEPESGDASEITAQIIQQLMAAESEDELFAEPTTWNSKDCVGQAFIFGPRGQINRSSIVNDEGRRGVFLSVEATDPETGEVGIFNTSSGRIAARLAWYAQHKGLPKLLRVVEHDRTARGFVVLDVQRVDKTAA